MRDHQTVDYAKRIDRALSAIEQACRAGKAPALSEVAEAAALSEYHFHRIFRLMTAETVRQTIERVRLGGSLPVLAKSGIMAATGQSGYATSQSFARAMRRRVGEAPRALAADEGLRVAAGESLRHQTSSADSGDGTAPPLAVEIVNFEPVQLVAVRNIGDYAALNVGYDRVFEIVMEDLGEDSIQAIYGIAHHDPAAFAAEELVFDCAVEPSRRTRDREELRAFETPGGRALHMVHHGDYDCIHAAVDRLYEATVAQGFLLSDALPLLHYRTPPDIMPDDELLSDIYLFLG
ncbi:MAG: AraC family transcriptional regulator [Erythrobacter sp.]